jgi:hypothetical protein
MGQLVKQGGIVIKNEDYLLRNVAQQIKPGQGGGVKHTKEYLGRQ